MIIISFLSAVLAGMGVGSAGFLVVYLTLALSMPQLEAQLLNLIFFISSAIAALFVNIYKRRLRPKVILFCALPGCLGAFAGATFAHSVSSDFLGKAFACLLIIMGAISLLRGKGAEKNNKE